MSSRTGEHVNMMGKPIFMQFSAARVVEERLFTHGCGLVHQQANASRSHAASTAYATDHQCRQEFTDKSQAVATGPDLSFRTMTVRLIPPGSD